MDLGETDWGVEWIRLRAVVIAVMNIRVLAPRWS
jgi:hypothetical protein